MGVSSKSKSSNKSKSGNKSKSSNKSKSRTSKSRSSNSRSPKVSDTVKMYKYIRECSDYKKLSPYKCPKDKNITVPALKKCLYGPNYRKNFRKEYNMNNNIDDVWYNFCLFHYNEHPLGFVLKNDDSKVDFKVPIFKESDHQGQLKKKKKTKKKKKKKKTKKKKKKPKTKKIGGATTQQRNLLAAMDGWNGAGGDWRPGFNTLTGTKSIQEAIAGIPLKLWGTSLPPLTNYQSDKDKLRNIFKYYIGTKKINRIISFQSCASGYHPDSGCNATDISQEDKMWAEVFKGEPDWIDLEPNVRDLKNIPIRDMTPGSLNSWIQLRDQPNFYDSKNSTIIHCYAGFGRTGAALLFFALRDYFNDRADHLREFLTNRYFNQGSSQGMFEWLKSKLSDFLYLDDTKGCREIKQKIGSFNPDHIVDEVFDIGSSRDMIQLGYLPYIFITRINYIIWCLKSYYFPGDNFPYYLYRCDHFKMLQERFNSIFARRNRYNRFAPDTIFELALVRHGGLVADGLYIPPVTDMLINRDESDVRQRYGFRFEPFAPGEFHRPITAAQIH